MKTTLSFKITLIALLISNIATVIKAQTTPDTYLGKIEYQDQYNFWQRSQKGKKKTLQKAVQSGR